MKKDSLLVELKMKIQNGSKISKEDVLPLFELNTWSDVLSLAALANSVREEFAGNEIHLCSILNAKSGRCSEDCAFCAQSAHYETGCSTY